MLKTLTFSAAALAVVAFAAPASHAVVVPTSLDAIALCDGAKKKKDKEEVEKPAESSPIAFCECEGGKKKEGGKEVDKPAGTDPISFCDGGKKKKGKDTDTEKPAI